MQETNVRIEEAIVFQACQRSEAYYSFRYGKIYCTRGQ